MSDLVGDAHRQSPGQHGSSSTDPKGPERAAAEPSTKSARLGLGSLGVSEPKPLTCMFVIEFDVCYSCAAQLVNIWLRTKRYDANGKVKSGTGGVCYLYFPAKPAPTQARVLRELGIL